MTYRPVIFICLFFLISLNLDFRWPVKKGKITSTFGESRGDHYHDGIDFISGNKTIYPVKDGELVFLWDKSLFPTENYPGGGNYKVLKHNDDFYTIYMHMENNLNFKNVYQKSEAIGKIGNTGHSFGSHLHLSVLHSLTNKSINPIKLLPEVNDKNAPCISDIFIRVEDTYYTIKNNDNIRITRHHPLLIKIVDSINGAERLGIYKLRVIFNSKEAVNTNFSEICLSKNGLTILDKFFQDQFDEKGYYKATDVEYINGVNNLLIIVADYSGNEAKKMISFNVNLDTQ